MNESERFRPLTTEEIAVLVQRGCRTESGSWDGVHVTDGFDATRLYGVTFGGTVCVGDLGGTLSSQQGPPKASEIVNAHLIDCCLGDNVRIANVGVHLANYDIDGGVCIENVGVIEAHADAHFGNGVEVSVLNEGGGREVLLFRDLCSQFAHLLCLFRHRPKLRNALDQMARSAAQSAHGSRGRIGENTWIRSVGELVNVNVGSYAVINGATQLVNGTVLSEKPAPTMIGAGVVMEDFIIAEGSSVSDSALISATYIGQGCRVGRQFSAENCLMFANCEAFHGEGCSMLAGPYTVTHHKSSLLIAGMFSFFNAGSGANQSNHLYKLGPVHEGKVERGSKMGSFAYMMWPCRVGPFSVVLGKHTRPFDIADFPFSHIEATPDGQSSLIPGFNLTTVGVVRDGAKWPTRDRRKGSKKRDRITFDVFSPLTVGRMVRGFERLRQLQQTTDKSVEAVVVGGAQIKRVFLRTGQKYFRRGIRMYLADRVVARLEEKLADGLSLPDALKSHDRSVMSEEWIDLGGQLMPAARLTRLCQAVEEGQLSDVDAVQNELDRIDQLRTEDEWVWVQHYYRRFCEVDIGRADVDQLIAASDLLLETRTEFLRLVLVDAGKEFDDQSHTGFGTLGVATADEDFQAVRGVYESNSFVNEIHAEIDSLSTRIERVKQLIKSS